MFLLHHSRPFMTKLNLHKNHHELSQVSDDDFTVSKCSPCIPISAESLPTSNWDHLQHSSTLATIQSQMSHACSYFFSLFVRVSETAACDMNEEFPAANKTEDTHDVLTPRGNTNTLTQASSTSMVS